jgi:hypothetical protein
VERRRRLLDPVLEYVRRLDVDPARPAISGSLTLLRAQRNETR